MLVELRIFWYFSMARKRRGGGGVTAMLQSSSIREGPAKQNLLNAQAKMPVKKRKKGINS